VLVCLGSLQFEVLKGESEANNLFTGLFGFASTQFNYTGKSDERARKASDGRRARGA